MDNLGCLPSAHIPPSLPMSSMNIGVPLDSQEGNYFHGIRGGSRDLDQANSCTPISQPQVNLRNFPGNGRKKVLSCSARGSSGREFSTGLRCFCMSCKLTAFVLYYLFKKILGIVIAVSNKVFFISDPGVSHLRLVILESVAD